MNNRRTILVMSLIFFPLIKISGNDCITLKNQKELCGKIGLKTENFWTRNEVIVNDSLKLSLGDVNKIRYQGNIFLRAAPGELLSNFAILQNEGRLSLYEKRESFQSGTQTFQNAKSKYFSIDNDTLHYFNLNNLLTQIQQSPTSERYLYVAYTKKWVRFGIRISSVVPFVIGLSNTQGIKPVSYLVPFGIGITMLAVPAFTISPSIRKDINKAIETFNSE